MPKLLGAVCAASVIALAACNSNDDKPSVSLNVKQQAALDKQRAREVSGPALHPRGLRRCVRRHGVRAVTARPYLGDKYAPDLELVISGRVKAFVGLYSDPARAQANLPAIRRDANNATVERMRQATIVWVSRPDAAVRNCVARARL
jgi:hypothetical protein